MSQVIMIGCDLHDRSMLLRYAVGVDRPKERSFANTPAGRRRMIAFFQGLANSVGASGIVLAYEASGLGFGWSDQLHEAGIVCHVLSPTLLAKSLKQAKLKTDSKDAQMLLEHLRGHVLAGNPLPTVWTPPHRLRDDRELVRARIDLADTSTRVKLQILSLLKRREIPLPAWYTGNWTRRTVAWLRETAAAMDSCVGPVVEGLIEQFELYRRQLRDLERQIRRLAKSPRYAATHTQLRKLPGVGLLTAMTFLTEMGDLLRFHNRREISAYLGLCPASYESGEATDRKGRITRQGPARVRRVLCQASWAAVRLDASTRAVYQRIRRNTPQRNKKAIVAVMRKLGILMWHRALACGVPAELQGRGGPHAEDLGGDCGGAIPSESSPPPITCEASATV
jgi:transposase